MVEEEEERVSQLGMEGGSVGSGVIVLVEEEEEGTTLVSFELDSRFVFLFEPASRS